MLRETILILGVLGVLAAATEVKQCDTGELYEDKDQVRISGCDVPPCKLVQNTNTSIEMKFVPEEDVKRMVTAVSALVFNVPLPFVGVDGTDACNDIYNADGTKTNCPLRKGVEYTYKKSFPVYAFYPRIPLTVIYELRQGNNRITCFQVPAAITK